MRIYLIFFFNYAILTLFEQREGGPMENQMNQYATAEIGCMGIMIEPMRSAHPYFERNTAMHMHMTYELHLLYDGDAHITTENGVYDLHAGEIALIPPHVYHAIHNVTQRFQLISISVQLYKLAGQNHAEEKHIHSLLNALSRAPVILLGSQTEMLRLVHLLISIQKDQSLGNEHLMTAYATEFLVHLLRALPDSPGEAIPPVKRGNRLASAVLLERKGVIEQYIADHYLSPSLAELAAMLSLSEQHIRRFLHDNYHMSFSQLLNNHRVNVSKHLLQNTQHSITEIWQLSGFSTPQNFSLAFRRHTGMTATSYRRMVRQKNR